MAASVATTPTTPMTATPMPAADMSATTMEATAEKTSLAMESGVVVKAAMAVEVTVLGSIVIAELASDNDATRPKAAVPPSVPVVRRKIRPVWVHRDDRIASAAGWRGLRRGRGELVGRR